VHFPSMEDAPVSLALLARKRVGCDKDEATARLGKLQVHQMPFLAINRREGGWVKGSMV